MPRTARSVVPFRVLAFCATLISGACVAAAALPFEARGRYLIENHTDREFQGHNQVWEGVQDARGILYFGNFNCLQEYDGEKFRRVELASASFTLETALDKQGRIWIGGVDDFGYLETEPDGNKAFVSLLDKLPEDDREFGFMNAVSVVSDGVYFGSGYGVYFWNGEEFKVWKWSREERPAAHLLLMRGEIPYLFSEGSNPLRLENGNWNEVVVDPRLRVQRVVDAVTESDGSMLLATSADGLWRLRGDAAAPVPTAADEMLRTASAKRMIRLHDGALLVGTVNQGAVILRPDWSVESYLDASAGLKNETVNALLEDHDGGLWISTNIGVSHVQRSAITVFGPQDGLPDMTIYKTFDFNGTLYVSADRGMYRLVPPSASGRRPRFERVPGVPENNSDIFVHHGRLYAITKDALVEIDETGVATPALEFKSRSTPKSCVPSELDPSLVFFGTGDGMNLLRWKEAHWTDEGPIEGFHGNVMNFTEAKDGSLWVATMSTGLFRLRPSHRAWRVDDVQVDPFPPGTSGLPEVEDFTVTWPMPDGTPCMGTAAGLFVWNAKTEQFESSSQFGPMLTAPNIAVVAGAVDPDGVLWAVLENHHDVPPWGVGEAGRVVNGVWLPFPARIFAPSSIVQGFTFVEEPEGRTAWCGSPNGLVRIEAKELADDVPVPPDARVRYMETLKGERLFSDGGVARETTVPYAQHNLRFEVAAPFFGPARSILFQTRLDGFEDTWSAPSTESRREITNLFEGRYRFRVRATDVDGRTGKEAVVAFRVLPPAYRSTGAYAGYLLLACFGVFGVVRWRGAALRRRNEQLESIVGERTAELKVARDDADRANRAKSTFLANMSHELRTPLNGILGYTQILRRSSGIGQEDRRRVEVLQASGEHLLRLINEVLDLSKIEAGKLELRPVRCHLRTLVNGVADSFRPRAEEKRLAMQVEIDPGVPDRVLADEQKLGQVLFNLVGNAVKFTSAGRIHVGVTPVESAAAVGGPPSAAHAIRFEVEDTGPGIPADQLPAIFEPFRQIEGSEAVKEGTGLGLTICARIVALMGGGLKVESEPGSGTRFWFEVILASWPGREEAATGEKQEALICGYEGERRRILVVDDMPVNRNVVREMLTPLGLVIDEAPDGASALEAVAKSRPDLVLMDLRMEPMSGVDVVRQIRDDEAFGEVKIVAFSASTIGFTREDAVRLGCDDFLSKPFREADLLSLIERLLGVTWTRSFEDGESVGKTGTVPDRDVLQGLLGLARRGDAGGFRRGLRTIGAESPELAGFVAEMEALVASYRMKDIRERLEELEKRA